MSAGLERLKQHDSQSKQHGTPETEVLNSILAAVEAQNSQITALVEQQQILATYVKAMDEDTSRSLQALTMQSSAPGRSDSSEIVSAELREMGQTLSTLISALDGQQVSEAVSALTSATTQLEKTTNWNAEQAQEFVNKYRQALNAAGRAINSTKDTATAAIEQSSAAAADVASAQVVSTLERLEAASEKTARLVGLAERLGNRLGWSAAARLALVLLPVCVVLLMGVQSVWALMVGIRWALAQNWTLWLNITAGTALVGLVAGAGFGLWRLSVWVKSALDDAVPHRGRHDR